MIQAFIVYEYKYFFMIDCSSFNLYAIYSRITKNFPIFVMLIYEIFH